MTEIIQSQAGDATYEEMERLLKSSVTIDILGVFHGALGIGRYLPSDE